MQYEKIDTDVDALHTKWFHHSNKEEFIWISGCFHTLGKILWCNIGIHLANEDAAAPVERKHNVHKHSEKSPKSWLYV